MIGNDIIDLKIARAERKSDNLRFMDKVFTNNEKNLILNAQDPDLQLWVLWSMKEAAYKAHQRIYDLPRILNPGSYECKYSKEENSGIVKIGSSEYGINILITSEYIHSTTYTKEYSQVVYANGNTSKYDLLINFLTQNAFERDEIQLSKDHKGIPSICLKDLSKKLPISLSHHGNFTAFTIPLINS